MSFWNLFGENSFMIWSSIGLLFVLLLPIQFIKSFKVKTRKASYRSVAENNRFQMVAQVHI